MHTDYFLALGHSQPPSEDTREVLRLFSIFNKRHVQQAMWNDLDEQTRLDLPSIPAVRSLTAKLSGIAPSFHDCCVNSCLAFTAQYQSLDICPTCGEPRYETMPNNERRSRKVFQSFSLIERLTQLYQSKAAAAEMRYRANYDVNSERDKDIIGDIFDGEHYKWLKTQEVEVLGESGFRHTYFKFDTDVAIGISTDEVSISKRLNLSAWPIIIIIIYNLSPSLRIHIEHVFCVGVIPGPKSPKDLNSFLEPLAEELLRLAAGVPAVDALTERVFCLRAHPIAGFGDMPAIAKLMRMVGPIGRCPCRFCNIIGVRDPDKPRVTTHFVPHDRRNFVNSESYDMLDLPSRNA